MRLSDLLHRRVLDEEGTDLGSVTDVRAVQDGPMLAGFGAALRIDGLVVGRNGLAVRLGYDRVGVRGPWPLKALFGRIDRRARYVEWERVLSWEDGEAVRIRGRGADLGRPPPLPLG